MKTMYSGIVVVLLLGMGYGLVIANGASEGDGICITISPKTLVLSGDVPTSLLDWWIVLRCSLRVFPLI